MQPKRTFSGAPWEKQVGYCRAVRFGGHIYISGTAASDSKGGVFAPVTPTLRPSAASRSSKKPSATSALTRSTSSAHACS